MGLDIYFHIVKKARKSKEEPMKGISEYSKLLNKRAKDRARKAAKKVLSELKSVEGNKEEYTNVYNNVFLPKVASLTMYAHRYAYMTDEVRSYDEVAEFWKYFISCHYAEEDAYFRKVNFIYKYFEDRLVDECCFVNRCDLENLVLRCDEVLSHHDRAEELLPTRSGFFFGSTEYDRWYYDSVRDARDKFEGLLRKFNDDTDVMFVVMSW